MEEGVAITKQKIYDLATIVSKDKRSPKVLMIVCSSVQYTPNNTIRAMVQNELGLDHYLLDTKKTVLIRVDQQTIQNPVLLEW